MVVAVYTIVIIISESHSLKDKRRVLMQLRDKITRKFNVSMAEIDHHNLWQKTTLGIACLANEQRHVNQVLDQVMNAIYRLPFLEVVDCRKEFT
ncbi:MAG: hypothetical protein CMH81_00645 [Nitrospiraceae bacterium]|nr:hypothetical protein [Nitrospiraceae bacterium]|tara:strand:- start:1188 stop:1469 length:282 start_codon:yes stop_codon:yes gene_type:complete